MALVPNATEAITPAAAQLIFLLFIWFLELFRREASRHR
jgi:hypothetical protein